MKKLIAILTLILTLAGVTACKNLLPVGNKPTPAPAATTEKWALSGFNAFTQGEDYGTNSALEFGTRDGKNVFAVIRFDIGATWFANEIEDARMYLKMKGTDAPKSVSLAMVTRGWDAGFTSYDEMMALLGAERVTAPVTVEGGGWVSLQVTEQVKAWVSGDLQNNGIALFGDDGALYEFMSYEQTDGSEQPYIKATGAVGERQLTYGKFGYTELREPDDADILSNCFAYSLRDKNTIENIHIGEDAAQMAQAYARGGVDALADYYAALIEKYVEAHKDGLKISSFRRLDGFDSPIDPKKEYRIALRVGVVESEGEVDFSDRRAFDYHFWLQLNDGRWAQKFPTGASQIVPGTNANVPPDRYPWQASYYWTPKSRDYYTSKVIYYAVTKDADDFTSHRAAGT